MLMGPSFETVTFFLLGYEGHFFGEEFSHLNTAGHKIPPEPSKLPHSISYGIHGTGIVTYMKTIKINGFHVVKYTIPMDLGKL